MGALIKNDEVTEFLSNYDSWANLATGLGMRGRDKAMSSVFGTTQILDQHELDNLYRGDGIAARLVDVQPADATRKWFELRISQEMENGTTLEPAEVNILAAQAQMELRRLGTRKKLKKALRWDQLYGVGILLMLIDDGKESEEPVDVANIKRVLALQVLHRYQVTPGPIEDDPESPHYGLPASYMIHTRTGVGAGSVAGSKHVHADRILVFASNDYPEDSIGRSLDLWWSDSVYQRTLEALTDYQIAHRAAMSLVHDFSQPVWTIPNLLQMVATNKTALLQNRFASMEFVRANSNAVFVDGGDGTGQGAEKFERVTTNVTGLPELLDRASLRLSAARGMPMTKLFGMAPKGFSNEDKAGDTNWNNSVTSYQEEEVVHPLERLTRYIFLQKEWDGSGKVPTTFEAEPNPLEREDPTEAANNRKTQSETDANYLDRQVLTPDEVADSRFAAEGYSTETTLNQEDREALEESETEAAEAGMSGDPVEGMELPEDLEGEASSAEAADPSEAFNGAQVASLQGMLVSVATGELPAAAVIQAIAVAYPLSIEQATAMVAPIEAQLKEQEAEAAKLAAQTPVTPGAPNAEPTEDPQPALEPDEDPDAEGREDPEEAEGAPEEGEPGSENG